MFGLPSPWLIGGSALLAFAAGSGTGWWAKGVADAPVIARAEKATGDMEVKFKSFVSQAATEAARASAQALRESNALVAELARSRTERDAANRARQRSSQELQELARNAVPTSVSPISPGALAVWNGLRMRQLAATAVAPAADRQGGDGLPATP